MREQKRQYWSNLIAEQETSGQSILAFCKQVGVGVHSFYMWRRRLSKGGRPVRFAELKTVASPAPSFALELILATGDRLRIGNGVDATTLRMVLDAVRP